MSTGRDAQKGAPQSDLRDEPRHQGGEREHRETEERRAEGPRREDGDRRQHDGDRQRTGHGGKREDDRRENTISHEDREDGARTRRTEPRR